MRRQRCRSVWVAALLLGCSSPTPSVMDAGVVETGAVDVPADRRTVARPGSPIDPRLFDCRAAGVPMRASAVAASCALDRACRTPQVIGHRGAGGQLVFVAPEVTLSAYRAAIALGIEFAETDPRLTADGRLVNIHDPEVDRTTVGTGEVSRMTLAEVQALRLRVDGFEGEFGCERVPTLLEVLRLCRGHITVVVDANKTDRVDLLVDAIRMADAVDWVTFSTSDVAKAQRAVAMLPGLRLHIRPRAVDQIATQLGQLMASAPVVVELGREDVAMGAPLVHAMGSRVSTNVFVEDFVAGSSGATAQYLRAFDDGADLVQTDRPSQVVAALRGAGRR